MPVKPVAYSRIQIGCKYLNPRVTFDGLNWWISVGIECLENTERMNGLT